jgi:uncharacterized protein YqjF (DUF2071 family)
LNSILKQVGHRPWPLPNQKWAYYQEWNEVVFLHYPVDQSRLSKMLPKGLELDLFDGQAWISLVAFTMQKIRPRYLPPFSPISDFYEFNVRTYVRHKGKSGVYFLSVEGAKKLSCFMARTLSDLPYQYATMKRGATSFSVTNKKRSREFAMQFEIGAEKTSRSELEVWLTERYGLFQDAGELINTFDLHHLPWTLYEVLIKDLKFDYPEYNALMQKGPQLMHYSSGVRVVSWEPIAYPSPDL